VARRYREDGVRNLVFLDWEFPDILIPRMCRTYGARSLGGCVPSPHGLANLCRAYGAWALSWCTQRSPFGSAQGRRAGLMLSRLRALPGVEVGRCGRWRGTAPFLPSVRNPLGPFSDLYRMTTPPPMVDKLRKTSGLVIGRASGGNAGVR
jgi:hypothetical protein